MTDLSTFTSKTFSDQLNTTFSVQLPDGTRVPLELVEVDEKPATPNTELFMLHFRGPVSQFLQQQTYRFEHTGLGSFDLFITAIEQTGQGVVYEAVFHRFRKS